MIEKLERLDCTQDSNGFELGVAYMNLCADGDYVSYEVARTREDALLEALTSVAKCINEREDVRLAYKLIREIEESR